MVESFLRRYNALLVVLAVVVLFTVPNPSLAIGMLIFGLWAAGLNLLVGYGGLVSFGHALPFAWGGYAAGLVLKHVTTSAWVALAVATVSMAVMSALVGAICLRRTEVYFSMLTLAFAQLGFFIALHRLGVVPARPARTQSALATPTDACPTDGAS